MNLHWMEKVFPVFFIMLAVSLPLSMAGMEAFSWGLTTFWIFWRLFSWNKLSWDFWKLPGLPFLAVFVPVMFLGAFLDVGISDKERLAVIGDTRWVLLAAIYCDLIFHKLIKVESLVLPLTVTVTLSTLFGFYQVFTGSDPFRNIVYDKSFQWGSYDIWRMKGFINSPMTYGNSMGILFCFFLTWFFLKKVDFKKVDKWLLTAVLFSGLSVFLSLTRGAWVGVFLTMGLLTLFYSRKLFLGALAGVILIAGLSYTTMSPIRERVDLAVSGKDIAVSDRWKIWSFYTRLIKENPLMGVGHRYTGRKIVAYQKEAAEQGKVVLNEHAHSNFLQMWAGLGVLGFFSFFGFIVYLLWEAMRNLQKTGQEDKRRPWVVAAIAGALCFHLSGITEATILDWELVHLYALCVGLVFAFIKQNKVQTHPLT